MSENEEVKTVAPASSFVDSQEFKDAVAKAASEAAIKVVAEVMAKGKANVGMDDLVSQLASQIAALTDQGTPMEQRRVAPEVLAERQKARERMGKLIMKAREDGIKPRYRAMNKLYLNEVLIQPYTRGADGNLIEVTFLWTGVPDIHMQPLNDVAKDIYAEFRHSIGVQVDAPLSQRPQWVTKGGLTIEGAAPVSMKMPDRGEDIDLEVSPGVRIANDPRKKRVNILGTVAAPAEQSVVDARI